MGMKIDEKVLKYMTQKQILVRKWDARNLYFASRALIIDKYWLRWVDSLTCGGEESAG